MLSSNLHEDIAVCAWTSSVTELMTAKSRETECSLHAEGPTPAVPCLEKTLEPIRTVPSFRRCTGCLPQFPKPEELDIYMFFFVTYTRNTALG